MRFPALQPVLALALFAAGPLLGCAGRVHAGFLVLNTPLDTGMALDRWAAPEGASWEDASWSVGLGEMPGQGDFPRGWWKGPPSERQDGQAPGASHLPRWLCHSGGGERDSSGGSGSGSPVLDASTTTQPGPQLMQIGLLFLDDHFYRPPPFASRLFRPPRLAESV